MEVRYPDETALPNLSHFTSDPRHLGGALLGRLDRFGAGL
ncbi:MAG: hypothetical protein RL145_258 [Pseudomonadota bacterium]